MREEGPIWIKPVAASRLVLLLVVVVVVVLEMVVVEVVVEVVVVGVVSRQMLRDTRVSPSEALGPHCAQTAYGPRGPPEKNVPFSTVEMEEGGWTRSPL
ncbi:unnamed protein product [Gadus morhua 'NCC']